MSENLNEGGLRMTLSIVEEGKFNYQYATTTKEKAEKLLSMFPHHTAIFSGEITVTVSTLAYNTIFKTKG